MTDKPYLCKNGCRRDRLRSIQTLQIWSRTLNLQSNATMLKNGKNIISIIWPAYIYANSQMQSLIVVFSF